MPTPLDRFEAAVRAHAFKGAQPADERDDIEQELADARAALSPIFDQIRDIPVPPSTGINAWIEAEVEKARYNAGQSLNPIDSDDAIRIARQAALAVIADRDTLVANLRRAGYTVTEPS